MSEDITPPPIPPWLALAQEHAYEVFTEDNDRESLSLTQGVTYLRTIAAKEVGGDFYEIALPDGDYTRQWKRLIIPAAVETQTWVVTGTFAGCVALQLDGLSPTALMEWDGTAWQVVSGMTLTEMPNHPGQPPPPEPPEPPMNLTATADSDSIACAWSASVNATSYTLHRGLANGGPYTELASGISALTYDDTTAVVGVTYYYVVTAVNSVGESDTSNQASAVIVYVPPVTLDAPLNLTATAGSSSITAAWNAVDGAASYTLKRGVAHGGAYTSIQSGITGTQYDDAGVTEGVTYYYVVVAVNGAGESQASNEANAQIPPPHSDDLLLWLSADYQVFTNAGTVMATDGQPVQQWNDHGPTQSNAIQLTSANRPTFQSNVIGGKPIIRFSKGSNTSMISPFLVGTSATSFVVMQLTGAQPYHAIENVIDAVSGVGNPVWFYHFDPIFVGNWVAAGANYTNGINRNEWIYATIVADSAAQTTILRMNGVPMSESFRNVISGDIQGFYIGNDVYNRAMTGDIAEIIVYNRKLTDGEQLEVESYLKTKYGL